MTDPSAATGLALDDVQLLSPAERRTLYDWHWALAGTGGWLPQAIRRMPLATRIDLAGSEALTEAWQAQERDRVVANPGYFVESYGHVEPPRGPALPFRLWPRQLDVLALFVREEKVVVLKARRLGLTWLALHYAFWLAAYAVATPGARVPIICKNREDATKLLGRAKRINDYLPPYIVAPTGADSATTLEFPLRGAEIMSLPATPGAGRLETSTLVILDEFAFPPYRRAAPIWTGIQPTIEGGGQLIVMSTGNGQTGDGETFATIWNDAQAGRSNVAHVFLPWQARPTRTVEWREEQRKDYLNDDEFYAEYPETAAQALAGSQSVHVYPLDGIAAAEYLGGELAASPAYLDLIDAGIEYGIDWGDFSTFTLYAVGLPGGGIYIIDELVQAHVEPAEASKAILRHPPAGLVEIRFVASRADSNPTGTNKTYATILDQFRQAEYGRYPESHLLVPFGKMKEGGGERRGGINTVKYIVRLLNASAREYLAWNGDVSRLGGCMAVHPRCSVFLAQMRNLERDAETGRVRKPSLDPRNMDKGDHGPDAAVALLAPRAAEFLSEVSSEPEA